MKFRQFKLYTGNKVLLGKNAENNDELMSLYKGKSNVILHTEKPGSPFCVLENLDSTKKEIKQAAIICASKSQDWRDNKQDVLLHQFTGKNIKKPFFSKKGTWKLTTKPKIIKAKKTEIQKLK